MSRSCSSFIPWQRKTLIAYKDCAHLQMTSRTWRLTDRRLVRVTPSTLSDVTLFRDVRELGRCGNLRLTPAVYEHDFQRFGSTQLQVVGLCPVCHMIEFNFSALDVAGRNHYVCIIGVLVHPVTRGYGCQIRCIDYKGHWANSRPLYYTGGYLLEGGGHISPEAGTMWTLATD